MTGGLAGGGSVPAPRVRVVVWHRCADDGRIRDAYESVSTVLAGTAGLLGNELLRSVLDPEVYLVVSEWVSLDAFRAWEQGPDHQASTSPLRAFRDPAREGRHFGVYEVTAVF